MSQSRLIALAVVLAAVLITAITLLASKPDDVTSAAAPEIKKVPVEAPASPPPEEENAVEWHATPTPGPLATVFQDSAGADVTLASFKGKVVVVNFWATWCAPCVKEMPTLNALQSQMADKLKVIAISQDRDAKITVPFIEKNGWKDVAYYTEPKSRFARDAQIRGLPTTIILDQSGQEVGRLEGTIDWTRNDVKAVLAKLAGG